MLATASRDGPPTTSDDVQPFMAAALEADIIIIDQHLDWPENSCLGTGRPAAPTRTLHTGVGFSGFERLLGPGSRGRGRSVWVPPWRGAFFLLFPFLYN